MNTPLIAVIRSNLRVGFRSLVICAAICGPAVVVSVPAHAQVMPGFKLGEDKEVSEDDKARNKANEDAARAASRSIAAPKPNNDPWADVRSTDSAAGAKAKKQAK